MVEVNLEHVDGRAKLKALAAPLFARMPEGIYREMLAESLAARVSMPAAALKRSFAAGDPKRPPRGPSGTRPAAARSNQRRARQFADTGHHSGAAPPRRGREVGTRSARRGRYARYRGAQGAARAGQDRCLTPAPRCCSSAGGTAPSTAGWRNSRWPNPWSPTAEAAAKELQMAVEKLVQEYGPGRRMDELLRKAEEMGLNYDEKAELSLLLKAKGRSRAPS